MQQIKQLITVVTTAKTGKKNGETNKTAKCLTLPTQKELTLCRCNAFSAGYLRKMVRDEFWEANGSGAFS